MGGNLTAQLFLACYFFPFCHETQDGNTSVESWKISTGETHTLFSIYKCTDMLPRDWLFKDELFPFVAGLSILLISHLHFL